MVTITKPDGSQVHYDLLLKSEVSDLPVAPGQPNVDMSYEF
ncbi:hypothetical protein [Streptococcus sp. 20-1249]